MGYNLSSKKYIFGFLFFLILLFFIGVFLIFGIYFWQGIFLPKEKNGKEKIFSVEKGENIFEIGKKLEKEGLIKKRIFFDFYVLFKGKQKKLQKGKYLLSSSMSVSEIAQKIINGEIAKIKITIPEGLNKKEIEEKIGKELKKEISLDFLIEEFKEEFNFFEDAPPTMNLEGFLFPDTYYFTFDESEKEIVRKFLKNFDKKISEGLRKEIKNQGKKIFETVIVASLIEKEVKDFEDKKIVSGILWKRLKNGIPLQVDATITYITGKKTTKISFEELKINHPYNTYQKLGLPPGPICNPGLESILAAIYPKESEYWYYLSTPEGKTIFSKTLSEHNLAKAKYLK